MLERIKEYFEIKKAQKTLHILLANKMSELIQKEIELKELEKRAIERVQKIKDVLTVDKNQRNN